MRWAFNGWARDSKRPQVGSLGVALCPNVDSEENPVAIGAVVNSTGFLMASPRKSAASAGKRARRVDWAAVERDFRTGKFTDIELAAKHGVARESIVRHRKDAQAKDPTAWAQDLGPKFVQPPTPC